MLSKSSSCRLKEGEKEKKKDHELHIKCFLTFVVESSISSFLPEMIKWVVHVRK